LREEEERRGEKRRGGVFPLEEEMGLLLEMK